MKNEELHKELKEHAPNLAQLREKISRPVVPDSYFLNLEEDMLRRLSEKGGLLTPKSSVKVRLYPLLGRVAAAVVVAGVATWLYFSWTAEEKSKASLANLDVEAYIFQHLDEFDEDLLLEYTSDLPFEEAAFHSESETSWETVSDEELNEYLEDVIDEIDETTLENLL